MIDYAKGEAEPASAESLHKDAPVIKTSRQAIISLALSAAALTALPATAAYAQDSGESTACAAARAGNNFTAWFYRTFLC